MPDKKDHELTEKEMENVSGGTILPDRRTPPFRSGDPVPGPQDGPEKKHREGPFETDPRTGPE